MKSLWIRRGLGWLGRFALAFAAAIVVNVIERIDFPPLDAHEIRGRLVPAMDQALSVGAGAAAAIGIGMLAVAAVIRLRARRQKHFC